VVIVPTWAMLTLDQRTGKVEDGQNLWKTKSSSVGQQVRDIDVGGAAGSFRADGECLIDFPPASTEPHYCPKSPFLPSCKCKTVRAAHRCALIGLFHYRATATARIVPPSSPAVFVTTISLLQSGFVHRHRSRIRSRIEERGVDGPLGGNYQCNMSRDAFTDDRRLVRLLALRPW